MKQTLAVLILLTTSFYFSFSQSWGLYTLVAPQNSSAQLVDTNGTVYKTWNFNDRTGYSCYLLPGGDLVRTVSYGGNTLWGGGMTGQVQIVDWDGNVTWTYTHSSSEYCLHHDICPLPNGNILMISYDVRSNEEVTRAGGNTWGTVQSEKIIEVRPTGPTTGEIVWEWYLWDHLCQDVDPSKDNYVQNANDHPERMNINYNLTNDWWHMNGIDYNAYLDQIIISSHYMNEIYVIDHSTTTEEAAGSTGGNMNKGGDFLYRWGNPESYGASGTTNFHTIHDAHWVPQDCPNANYMTGYNNEGSNGKTCFDIFLPPYDGKGYVLEPQTYNPQTYSYRHTYTGNTNTNMGNAQQLPNGNSLVCIAGSGYIYEVDAHDNVLWSYSASGRISQASRYSECYVNGTMPETPTVVQSGSTLSSSVDGESYQWYFNMFPIEGATAKSYNPTESGDFQVQVINSNDCRSFISNAFNYSSGPVPQSLSIEFNSAEMEVGEEQSLSAIVLPSEVSQEVLWYSSAPLSLSIDSEGVIRALAIMNDITITAKSAIDTTITGTITISVIATDVEEIEPSTENIELFIGETELITVTVFPENATDASLSWLSDNENIATVVNGTIEAIAQGSTTITVSSISNPNISETISVTVLPIAPNEIILADTLYYLIGDVVELEYAILPESASQLVSISTNNTSILEVEDLSISALEIGTTQITVTSVENTSVFATAIVIVSPIYIDNIEISVPITELAIGETLQATATVNPNNATNSNYTWSVSDPSIATISESGLITAISAGIVIITADAIDGSGVSENITLTVYSIPVENITVVPANPEVFIGDSLQLEISISPENATIQDISWIVESNDYAIISNTGMITGLAEGEVQVTVLATDDSGVSESFTVNIVKRSITNITLIPSTIELTIGESTTIEAIISPENATITELQWISSNENIATVSNGSIVAIGEGSVTITATSTDGSNISGNATVSVSSIQPISVTTSESIGFMLGDDSQTLTATVLPQNTSNKAVRWYSSNTAIATVDSITGEVTPIGEGTCEITVECIVDRSITATCNVTVANEIIAVESISINSENVILQIGESENLSISVYPTDATNKAIIWNSSNTDIVGVSNGVITGYAIGSATITATSVDGNHTSQILVTVSSISVESVSLNRETVLMNMDSDPLQLTATVFPANATNKRVTWRSTNSSIVSVNSGVVSVQNIGSAYIIVTTLDGNYTDSCLVQVNEIALTSIRLSENIVTTNLGTASYTLTATVLPENATNQVLIWQTSNANIATVQNGIVTFLSTGTVVVSASNEGGNIFDICVFTITAIEINEIVIEEETLQLSTESAPTALTWYVLPTGANSATVQWTSSNESVATVQNGIITVVEAGSATIIASSESGQYFDYCEVTVSEDYIPVENISLAFEEITLEVGENSTLSASVIPNNATNPNITFNSSNPALVSVDANGIITAIAATSGVIITATTQDGISASAIVIVNEVATVISSILAQDLTLEPGETEKISYTTMPAEVEGTEFIFSIADTSIATIDNLGNVTAGSIFFGDNSTTATISLASNPSIFSQVTITVIGTTDRVLLYELVEVALDIYNKVLVTHELIVSDSNGDIPQEVWNDFLIVQEEAIVTLYATNATQGEIDAMAMELMASITAMTDTYTDISDETEEVSVYPTYFDNQITVKANGLRGYELINASNQIILSNTNTNKNEAIVNTSGLASGIYCIVIKGDSLITSRIIIKK